MKTNHNSNKLRSHLVTIIPMKQFTLKSTSKLRFALHFRYSIVIPPSFPVLKLPNPNNHYNHGFNNTFDYNPFIYSDYLLCTVTASADIIL